MKSIKLKNQVLLSLLTLFVVCNLTACGGNSISNSYDAMEYAVAETSAASYNSAMGGMDFNLKSESVVEVEMGSGSSSNETYSAKQSNPSANEQMQEAKLIRTVELRFEADDNIVINVVDDFVSKVESLGGYAQENNVSQSGRWVNGDLVLRIPAEHVDEFLEYTDNKGLTLVNKSDNQEDVTLQWSDIETRIKVLDAQRDKYLGYIENAKSVEEILAVDSKLQGVLTELELYSSRMRVLSNQVNYSTIYVDIEYEGEYAPTTEAEDTFFEKLSDRLTDSIDNMLDMFIDAIGLLIELIVPLLTLMFIVFVLIQVFRLFRFYWNKRVSKGKKKEETVVNNSVKKKFKLPDTDKNNKSDVEK